jgi:hypothetical protein
MFPDDEWNWLNNYILRDGNIIHEDDDEYGNEPSEIETDPQYGSLDRFRN